MSKEHENTPDEQGEKRCFTILDREKGIFKLWYVLEQRWAKWQIDDEGKPGILILMQRLEEEGSKISELKYSENFASMSDEEKKKANKRITSVAHKQIAVMASYCENLDPIPELLENKIEFLAACLNHNQDAAKINAFFLIKSATSTTSLAELKGELDSMMETIQPGE